MISKKEEDESRWSEIAGLETVTKFPKDDEEGWQFCNQLIKDLLKFAPLEPTGTSKLHERARFLKKEWSLDYPEGDNA